MGTRYPIDVSVDLALLLTLGVVGMAGLAWVHPAGVSSVGMVLLVAVWRATRG